MKILNLIKGNKLTEEIIDNISEIEIDYINSATEIDSSPLFIAISTLNPTMIKKLFENQKINLNIIANKNISLLNYAIDKNNFEVVKLLINDKRFKLLNFKFNLPLIQAFEKNNKDILKLLLNAKEIDLNIVNEKGNSILILALAIDNKKCELAKLILENKNFININHKNHEDDTSALHYAVSNNKVELIKLLLDYGADINIKQLEGATPLHFAIRFQHMQSIKLLLEEGADINVKIQFDITALHLAAYTGNNKIISLLLENPELEANNIESCSGLTPIQYLLRNNNEWAATKVARFIAMQDLLQKNPHSDCFNNDLDLVYQTNYILLKNKIIIFKHDFLTKPKAKKILDNINKSHLCDHKDYVSKYITNYENLLNNKNIKIDQSNLEFLEDLKSYLEHLLLNINNLEHEYNLLKPNNDKSFNEKLKLVKKFRQEYLANNVKIKEKKDLQQFQESYDVSAFETDNIEEKRVFLKKEKQTPKFQQPKIRNIDGKKVSTMNKHDSSTKVKHKKILSIAEQSNLLAIEAWEKQVKKQNAIGKSSFTQSKNPMSLIKNFPNFQESLINLNSIELDETQQWWNNIILNANEEVINDLENEIIKKVNTYDKKERKLTEKEFELLQKIRKQNSEEENIFPIIILHRNDFQDHEKGRPAIRLEQLSTSKQELVIPGTTRKIECYNSYQYNLNGIETYFYLKDIILIDEKFNYGLWAKNSNIKLSQNDIKKLLGKIDEFYDQKIKLPIVNQIMPKNEINEIGIAQGAIPKQKF